MSFRRLVLPGLIVLLLLATPSAASDQDRDATLLAYVDVWNSGELDRLDALVAPDFQRHGGPDESCRSRDELKALIGQTRTIFKHVRLEVDDHMTEPRGGALRGSFYGVHTEIDRIVEFEAVSAGS